LAEKKPAPPKGLTPKTRRWFHEVVERWELESHHVHLLGVASRALDEMKAAERLIDAEGLVVIMPSGARRPNPAVRIANECRAVLMRAIRELDLDISVPAELKRPPLLRSIGGRQGRG
jgi:hypothetical protein